MGEEASVLMIVPAGCYYLRTLPVVSALIDDVIHRETGRECSMIVLKMVDSVVEAMMMMLLWLFLLHPECPPTVEAPRYYLDGQDDFCPCHRLYWTF